MRRGGGERKRRAGRRSGGMVAALQAGMRGMSTLFAFHLLAGSATARAGEEAWFLDRPPAWSEHDDADVPRAPEPTHLQDLDTTLLVRDSLANEVDWVLVAGWRPPGVGRQRAGRGPLLDLVLRAESPAADDRRRGRRRAIGGGRRAAAPDCQGQGRRASPGFQVVDAKGRKFMLKFDPAGRTGLTTGAEMIGGRIFHAAGYNVPGSQVVDRPRGSGPGSPCDLHALQGAEASPDRGPCPRRPGRRRAHRRRAYPRWAGALDPRPRPGRLRHPRAARRRSERSDRAPEPPFAAGQLAALQLDLGGRSGLDQLPRFSTSSRAVGISSATTSSTSARLWVRRRIGRRSPTRPASTRSRWGARWVRWRRWASTADRSRTSVPTGRRPARRVSLRRMVSGGRIQP